MSRPTLRRARLLLAGAGVLAAAGATLGMLALVRGGDAPLGARDAPASAAWNAASSFGPVSVERLERFPGGSHAGGGHNAADAGTHRIRVFVRVTNGAPRAVPFSPGQFRLRFGSQRSVPPTRPNPPPDAIAPGQTLDNPLDFVVPATGRSFTLVFDDVGRASPLAIRLGALPGQKEE